MDDFKNIYGQDLAIQILRSTISKQHISPAYLFSGPEGVGRKKTAKVFRHNANVLLNIPYAFASSPFYAKHC